MDEKGQLKRQLHGKGEIRNVVIKLLLKLLNQFREQKKSLQLDKWQRKNGLKVCLPYENMIGLKYPQLTLEKEAGIKNICWCGYWYKELDEIS